MAKYSSAPHIRRIKSMSMSALPIIDEPYTSPDEDPFSARSHLQELEEVKSRSKRTSMLENWIKEQQCQPDAWGTGHGLLDPPPAPYSRLGLGSLSNPYLAYPELPSQSNLGKEDSTSLQSYDLVEDSDIPSLASEEPVTPNNPRTGRFKAARHSVTPSLRTLNFSLRSPSHTGPSSTSNQTEGVSRALARFSLFPRTPRSSSELHLHPSSSASTTPQQKKHNRSTSLSSTLTGPVAPSTPSRQPMRLPSSATKWRPSVRGHFHPSASMTSVAVSDAQSTPSRPSISSNDTYPASDVTATTFDSGIAVSPTKTSFLNSLRMRANRSTRTVCSIPSSQPFTELNQSLMKVNQSKETLAPRMPLSSRPISTLHNIDDEDDLDGPPTYRLKSDTSKRLPIPQPSNSTLRRINFSSIGSRSGRKRKKLIVSGIGATEVRKYEGMKRWCQSFGEIRSLTRLPNGDLQIDFKDPEVADTVCRIRAKVFIGGVGSVQLSWTTGSKR